MNLRPISAINTEDGFRVSRATDGSAVVVEVAGELDLHSSFTLRDRLISIVESGAASLLVDLTGVSFIDSTGLGVLAVLARRPTLDATDLAIVCPEGRVRKALRMAGLEQVISIHATRDRALRLKAAA